jgi:hypothetical protein
MGREEEVGEGCVAGRAIENRGYSGAKLEKKNGNKFKGRSDQRNPLCAQKFVGNVKPRRGYNLKKGGERKI